MDRDVLKGSPLSGDYTLVDFAVDHRDLFDRLDAAFEAKEELTVTEEEFAPFAMWAQMRLSLGWEGGHEHDERRLAVIRDVIGRMTVLPLETVKLLWHAANRLMIWRHTAYLELYRLPLAAVGRLPYHERRDVLDLLPKWFAQRWKPAWEVLREQIEDLLTEPETGDPAAVVRNLMWEDDAFATLLIEQQAARLAAPEVLPLLRQWNTATSSRPSARWLKQAAALLTPQAGEVIRDVLRLLTAHRETTVRHEHRSGDWTEIVFLRQRTSVPLRGMIWTCELVDEPWVVPLLGDVAVTTGTGIGGSGPNARSEMLANAAVGVLGRRGGMEVVAQLARVQAKARKKSVLSGVTKTLDAVAQQEGLTRDQLLERTVPTYGLGPDGVRADQGLRLTADGAVTYTDPSGKVRKTIPKSVDRALLAEFRATAKELRKTLSAERFRIERALATERLWRWRDVCAYYLDHPVTGAFARTLIWEIPDGPAGIPVRRDDGWELTDPAGRRVPTDLDTLVRLWHPIRHGVEEVRAWRDHLMDLGLRQPFKQAFREVYLLTPAEVESRDQSFRFARHLLRYGTAKALLSGRGWTGMSLGHWGWEYESNEGDAVRELPEGLTAHWEFGLDEHSFDRDGGGTVSICVSGPIRFTGPDGQPVPLNRIPPLVLSETLRDADLAVGVTSTGLDPEGDGEYWQSYSFGDLTENARVRRDALTRLLPRLAIGGRCEVTDRFLHVRGDLRTYKIHLGSGNILMEPNDAYLCIVPGGRGEQVFLPFEEDGMLSVILSKAFLLAADTTITDPSITRQILG